MDNLTQVKKNRLLKECSDKILETPLFHNDIMKMYAYIYDCTATSDTLAEIQLMETVKSSLDFLVRGVVNVSSNVQRYKILKVKGERKCEE